MPGSLAIETKVGVFWWQDLPTTGFSAHQCSSALALQDDPAKELALTLHKQWRKWLVVELWKAQAGSEESVSLLEAGESLGALERPRVSSHFPGRDILIFEVWCSGRKDKKSWRCETYILWTATCMRNYVSLSCCNSAPTDENNISQV